MTDPVVAAVKAEATTFAAKAKAFVVKYGPYAAGFVVGLVLGHIL